MRRIVDECYAARARPVCVENRDQLDSLAKALLEHETLDERDAYAAAGFDRQTPTPSQPPAAVAARDNQG